MKGRKARKDNLLSLNTQIQTQTIIVIHYLRKSKMCGFPENVFLTHGWEYGFECAGDPQVTWRFRVQLFLLPSAIA